MGIYWVIHQKPIPPILWGTVMWLGCIIRNVVYDSAVSYQFINFSVSRGMNSFRTLPLKIMDFATAFDVRGISFRLIHHLLENIGHTKIASPMKVFYKFISFPSFKLPRIIKKKEISVGMDYGQSIHKFYCSVHHSGNGTMSFNKNRTHDNR